MNLQSAELSLLQTERAILDLKRFFEDTLANNLRLHRVSAPMFVSANSGIQDDLNGIERPVSFTVRSVGPTRFEIVHSLAKWKRLVLARYAIPCGEGIYTDMNALRPDEPDLNTCIHSVYVDQWDWEKIITPDERSLDFLKATVKTIYGTILATEHFICSRYGLKKNLPDAIHFIHTEELLGRFPELSPKDREHAICEELGAVFLIGIGGRLSDGKVHDGRAPDYDDWTTETKPGCFGLNGDILVFNPIFGNSFELSSMGIRVTPEILLQQLKKRNCEQRAELPWHKMLLDGDMPLTIGGGIGQSRLSMLLLRKNHIGEVQVSVWPEEVQEDCRSRGIQLL